MSHTASMHLQTRSKRNSELKLGLKWSVIGHILLLFVILVQTLFFPADPIPYIPTLRVDLVGLPDVLKKDLKTPKEAQQLKQDIAQVMKEAEQAAKPPVAKPEPVKQPVAKKDEMVLPDAKKQVAQATPVKEPQKDLEAKNKNALARIKALAKIQESEPRTEVNKLVQIKGNKISPGTSLSGEAKEGLNTAYFDLVRDRLQENWTLPPWIKRQNFAAQILIFIDAQGRVKNLNFVKPSGNAQFDEAVKKALQESQPFPTPPESFQASLVTQGILIGFPL